MRPDADVIIAGAGIAGLGLACALSRHDVRILLVERRPRTGGIHRGDSLLPKATRMLERAGVLDAIRAAGAEPIDRMEIHHHRHGKVCEVPLTPPGAPHPYLVLPHAKIEEVLLERALASGRTTLVRPAHVTGVLREGGRVAGVRFERPDGAGGEGGAAGEARARLVVAADGHASAIRASVGIGARVVPYDHAYLGLEADRPPTYENAMRLHFHEEGGVLLMPRATRVGVGVLVDAGSAPRWMGMSDADLSRALAARAPILAGLRLDRKGAHVYALARAHARRYCAAGTVLIGDAAHATNPTAGQGMAMALCDASDLADRVGPALAAGASGGALALALAAYERSRWPANEALVRRSHLLALVYALRGRAFDRLKVGLLRALGSSLGARLAGPVIRAFLADRSGRTEDDAGAIAEPRARRGGSGAEPPKTTEATRAPEPVPA